MSEAGTRVRQWADDLRAAAPDLALALGLAILAFAATLACYAMLSPAIYDLSTWDYWFESDPYRTYDLARDRTSIHHHSTSHHPLFSAIFFPPVQALRMLLGITPEAAIGIVLATTTALWLVCGYLTLRLMKLRRLDATAFALVMATSAATLFWFPVPETFGVGALTIMIVMLVAAAIERRGGRAPNWVYVLAGVAAISATTTNWTAGLALLLVFLGWRAAILRATETMILTLAIWALQKIVFPEADNFLNIFRGSEVDYVFNEEALGVIPKLIAFFFHSIVMPDITVAYGYRLTVQPALPGQGGPIAVIAVLIWTGLMALGGWGAWRLFRERGLGGIKTIAVLVLALGGQLLITILFGIESFLYTPHFAALLVLFAALGVFSPARPAAVALAFGLAGLAGFNNVQKLQGAGEEIAQRYDHERRYAETLAALTEPDALIVCGARALKASGEGAMTRDPLETAAPSTVSSDVDPDTCAFTFADQPFVPRQGWRLWYEDWSPEAIDMLAQRGARYFATQYEYGLAEQGEFFDALDARYAQLARTSEWAIYDLQSPPAPRP